MTTTSETHLATLARYAFLRMWSYPNLYNDKGSKVRGAIGQELCDLLLVFGNSLVIFSDKHCALRDAGSVSLSWQRWYRRAVEKSADQVRGAERWICDYPERIFQDARCQEPLPLRLAPEADIFRVLTIRGAKDAARSEWGGRGSLLVTNRGLAECAQAPFRLGAFDAEGRLFHIFDENALDAVLATLDTPSDFLAYLRERERLFRQPRSIVASSEEDLLGLYMLSYDQGKPEREHRFDAPEATDRDFIDGERWDSWVRSPERRSWDSANRGSYLWDGIIDRFVHHAFEGTQEFALPPRLADQEVLLRWLCRENRFRRRVLSQNIMSMVTVTTPGRILRRLLLPQLPGDPYWVFIVLPRPVGMEYKSYREQRRRLLVDHAFVVKHLHPEAQDITGLAIGVEHDGESEDAIYLDARIWSESMATQARRAHEEGGIFKNAKRTVATHWEYPTNGTREDV